MDKKIVTPLIILIVLIIFIIMPYKKMAFEKSYTNNINYRAFKRINTVDELYSDFLIIYNNKTSKMDFYYNYSNENNPFIREIQKVMYFEVYIPTYSRILSIPDEWYDGVVLVSKDDKIKDFKGEFITDFTYHEYLKYTEEDIKDFFLKEKIKIIEPFIPKLHKPKEFYEIYKEYFVPYYLADYEIEIK